MRKIFAKFFRWMRRTERRVLIGWIRFARAHRDSSILPLALFGILFMDGFTMVIPSIICLVAAITISPHRWALFALIFAFAATSNNAVTYILGRTLPHEWIVHFIQYFNLDSFWEQAQAALRKYGALATFWGAILGLPVQMITALIGIADTGLKKMEQFAPMTWHAALLFAFLGHGLKAFAIAILARYGWLKLERKFGKEVERRDRM